MATTYDNGHNSNDIDSTDENNDLDNKSDNDDDDGCDIDAGDESESTEGRANADFETVSGALREENGFYTYELPHRNMHFNIDRSDWNMLRGNQRKRYFSREWVTVFAKGIKSVNNRCCFNFKS